MNFMQYLRSKQVPAVSPLTQREINPVPPTEQPPVVGSNPYAPAPQEQVDQIATGIDTSQIVDKLAGLMDAAEKITGVNKRDLTMALLKSGLKGNGIAGIVDGLMGQKPPAEAKFIRYTKTIVTWGLVAIFFGGLILITLVAYAHFMTKLMGV